MRIEVRRGEPRTLPPAPAAELARPGRGMRARRSVVCTVGTRPEVIKMAPVIRALRAEPALQVSVLSSGQHRDLLGPLIDWFELSIDADLQVMTQDQSLRRADRAADAGLRAALRGRPSRPGAGAGRHHHRAVC